MNTNLDTLAREIGYMNNRIRNDLTTRATHPTYGISKTELRRLYGMLEGMVIAHRIVSGEAPSNPTAVISPWARDVLGIDLLDLHRRITDA